jgi:very-short-patch-repair endonuclease
MSSSTAPAGESDMGDRRLKIRSAIADWKKQLLDLSGRNALLYFKDYNLSTLDLSPASPTGIDRLLAREWISLSALLGIHGDATMSKRLRAIRKKALENYEERGIQTLFFTWGMVSWRPEDESRKSVPRAPLLLFPAELKASDAREDDHRIQLVGDPAVNPTLVHYLTSTFGVNLEIDSIGTLPGIEGEVDTRDEVGTIIEWFVRSVSGKVPEFSYTDQLTLANYAYQKMPMVEDLDAAEELLVTSDLVAAIAGDRQAQQSCTSSIGDEPPPPDYIPPADEFLTQDADSTQNAAINAAVAGRSLIIEGPPGTGKSQTIANLISVFVGRGKRVLFVAEKRAAIDAVMSRLERVGLSDLVLDLHSGSRSKRAQVQALENLREQHVATMPVAQAYANDLIDARSRLVENDRAMNEVRAPWNVSLQELYGRMLQFATSDPVAHRLSAAETEAASAEDVRRLTDTAGAWDHAGGSLVPHGTSAWRDAQPRSGAEVEACLDAAQRLTHHLIPALVTELQKECKPFLPDATVTLARCEQLESLATRAAALSAEVVPAFYAIDLPVLLGDISAARKGPVSRLLRTMTSGRYRFGMRVARRNLPNKEKAPASEVYAAVQSGESLRADWISAGGQGAPERAGDLERLRTLIRATGEAIEQMNAVIPQPSLDSRTLAQLDAWATWVLSDRETALRIPAIRESAAQLRAAGFGPLLNELIAERASVERAREAVALCWLQSLLGHIEAHDPNVRHLGRPQQDEVAARYRQLDHRHIEATPRRIRRRAAEAAIRAEDVYREEALALKAAVRRRKGIPPLREIFARSPNVITAWAPCWTMSPLLVSQMLPATGVQPFDLVIFDEASQVLPADAIPAIARAKQAVVAGDRRQLPPTTFFATSTDEDAEPEPEDSADLAFVQGYESVLDVMDIFLPSRDLMWHYRSEDERLIAFSNAELYGRRLTTFPGVSYDDVIRHVVVDPGEATTSESARSEVEAVVRLVLEHAETQPQRSLGVITMGAPHKLRIEEALRRARTFRPDLDSFFSDGASLEPFFVKNLERVQGDERDCIILSIGYGKGPDGRILYNFGPINKQGGERRLNVAVTRAKHSLVLVSTFRGDELDESKCQATGMSLLRKYTLYADRGGKLDRNAPPIAEINAFERDVADSLKRKGMTLRPQYGVSGYRIDFVVAHPSIPDRWILAIECDGATYHSAHSARDRDRLRQEHLERLGWRFHRIWSTEWFKNKPGEVDRAWAALQDALRIDQPAPAPQHVTSDIQATAVVEAPPPVRGQRPYVTANRGIIDAYSDWEITSIVQWIKSDGRLRSEDELLAAVMEDLGFERRGAKIVDRIMGVIRYLEARPK